MLEAKKYNAKDLLRAVEIFITRSDQEILPLPHKRAEDEFVGNVFRGDPVWLYRYRGRCRLFAGSKQAVLDAVCLVPEEFPKVQMQDVTTAYNQILEEAADEQEKGVRDDS